MSFLNVYIKKEKLKVRTMHINEAIRLIENGIQETYFVETKCIQAYDAGFILIDKDEKVILNCNDGFGIFNVTDSKRNEYTFIDCSSIMDQRFTKKLIKSALEKYGLEFRE